MEQPKVKKTIVDAFVEGGKNGFNICTNSMVPNVLFAFAIIQVLNLTGLTEIIGKIFQPVMAIFGLPGVGITVLLSSWLSIGGGVGVAASLYAEGLLDGVHIAILMPAIMLIGAQLQYMGRVLGTAKVKNKYYGHAAIIGIINALLSMLVMRFLV